MSGYEYGAVAPQHRGKQFIEKSHKDTYPEIDPSKADLSGKAIFVTGASKGIGRATAISYAKAGASSIAVGARSDLSTLKQEVEAAAEGAGRQQPKFLSISLDVQNEKSVSAAAKQIEEEFGRLDILINNAGYLENWKPMAEADPLEWWKTWDVNIRGVFLVTRACLPLMLRGGDKTIINVTSAGAHSLSRGGSAYQSTKFALLKLTEFMCLEYGPQGLLAFSIHPGGVPTELAFGMPEHMHAILGDTPEMAADAMVFLTKERQDWLAGRYVSTQWDMPELLSRKKEIVDGDKLKTRLVT